MQFYVEDRQDGRWITFGRVKVKNIGVLGDLENENQGIGERKPLSLAVLARMLPILTGV